MTIAQLNGLCVLVIEDDFVINMLVEDILTELGCKIFGPYSTYASAFLAAQTQVVDVALLDVNLAGVMSYPIGEVLAARRIPFVLMSGYGESAAREYRWATLGKPFTDETLQAALLSLLPKAGAT